MHEKNPLALPVFAAVLLAALGVGCGSAQESEPSELIESIELPDSSEASVEPGGAKPGQAQVRRAPADVGSLASVIAKEHARVRHAPGREGILTEQRLYSLFDEELIIRDFFQDRRNGFFLDVGCAWPDKANNTFYLEKHLGWSGIGIDALLDYAPG